MSLLLAIDPLGLALGIVLVGVAIGSFMAREDVAQQLARAYQQQRPRRHSRMPAFWTARFGIRETRIISVLVASMLMSVRFCFIIAAVF